MCGVSVFYNLKGYTVILKIQLISLKGCLTAYRKGYLTIYRKPFPIINCQIINFTYCVSNCLANNNRLKMCGFSAFNN